MFTVKSIYTLVTCLVCCFGCVSKAELHSVTEQAIVFEERVRNQAERVQTVFEAVVASLPQDQQADARAAMAHERLLLNAALDSKDLALQAIADGTAPGTDLAALVSNIVSAVEGVIAVAGRFGVPQNVVTSELEMAKTLRRGL
jgi:hypothetical protein